VISKSSIWLLRVVVLVTCHNRSINKNSRGDKHLFAYEVCTADALVIFIVIGPVTFVARYKIEMGIGRRIYNYQCTNCQCIELILGSELGESWQFVLVPISFNKSQGLLSELPEALLLRLIIRLE